MLQTLNFKNNKIMSKEEGVQEVKAKAEELGLSSVMPKNSEIVAGPPNLTKAQQQAMHREAELQRKNEARNRAEYRKELISNNELKAEQVKEIELNIAYYKAKKEWFDLIPEIEALEAKEKALMQKEKEEYQAKVKAQMELQKKQQEEAEKKPDIVVLKVGKPRE